VAIGPFFEEKKMLEFCFQILRTEKACAEFAIFAPRLACFLQNRGFDFTHKEFIQVRFALTHPKNNWFGFIVPMSRFRFSVEKIFIKDYSGLLSRIYQMLQHEISSNLKKQKFHCFHANVTIPSWENVETKLDGATDEARFINQDKN